MYDTLPWILAILVACHHPAPPSEGEQRAAAVAHKLVGAPAPALTLTTLDGQALDLAALYGKKPVYLKFWATWCVPCNEQMPKFQKLYETYGDRVAIIAVDAGLDDAPATVRAFRDKHGMTMPLVIDDGRLADALDLQVTPQHVLIGRDGKIAYVGHEDGDPLEAALAKVIADAPSDVARLPAAPARSVVRAGDVANLSLHADRVYNLADHKKRAIELFATWCEGYLKERAPASAETCGRVRQQIDTLRAAHPDIEFVGVANPVWASPEDAADYAKKNAMPVMFDADGAVFRAFDVHDFGTVVLIGSDGKVAQIVRPADDLRTAIEALP